MARHKNELLQTLENDTHLRNEFIKLLESLGNARSLKNHINQNGIGSFKPRIKVSWQTMSNIIRRLNISPGGRKKNKLEKLLLEDPMALKEFTSLVNQYPTIRALWGHLKTYGFRGEKFNRGYQRLCSIVYRVDKYTNGHVIDPTIFDNNEDLSDDFYISCQNYPSINQVKTES